MIVGKYCSTGFEIRMFTLESELGEEVAPKRLCLFVE